MNWFETLCNFAEWFNGVTKHSFWTISFAIGLIILVLASILIFLVGYVRKKAISPDTATAHLMTTPMITVVMCCKGTHSESYNNFRRNLSMEYPGKVEFIFVVESEDDPAVEAASKAINDTIFMNPEKRSARIEVAGVSYHNAQKCHNMLYGVICSDPESEYVLFPDDDVFLYPGLIDELLVPLLDEPDKVILATGYEFVAPAAGSSIAVYSNLMYRMHNLFSFITDRPVLCWGGCWFSPIRLFKENFANLVDCYNDGGYSDDTIISCLVQQEGYVCAHPYRATFPNQPDVNLTFGRFFEFLKRQMFVLDTYSTGYNKRVNHSLAFLVASSIWLMIVWDFVAPIISILSLALYPTGKVTFSISEKLSFAITFMWLVFVLALKWSTETMTKCANSVRPPSSQIQVSFSLWKAFIGLACHLLAMPFAMISIMINNSIVWAGVRYYKENGKICKVERKDKDGNTITIPFKESIANFVSEPRFRKFFPSGTLSKMRTASASQSDNLDIDIDDNTESI